MIAWFIQHHRVVVGCGFSMSREGHHSPFHAAILSALAREAFEEPDENRQSIMERSTIWESALVNGW